MKLLKELFLQERKYNPDVVRNLLVFIVFTPIHYYLSENINDITENPVIIFTLSLWYVLTVH